MDVKPVRRRVFERIVFPNPTVSGKPVFKRLVSPNPCGQAYEVCRFWVRGKCNRNPCRFLHSQPEPDLRSRLQRKRPNTDLDDQGEVPILRKKLATTAKNENDAKSAELLVRPGSPKLTEVVNSGLDDLNSGKKLITAFKIEDGDLDDIALKIEAKIKDLDDTVVKAEDVGKSGEGVAEPPNSQVIIKKEEDSDDTVVKVEDVGKSGEVVAEPQIQPPNSELIIKKEEDLRLDSEKLTEVVVNPEAEAPKSSSDDHNCKESIENDDKTTQVKEKLCKFWINSSCVHGEKCRDLHSWFTGSGLSRLANLERRHRKAITGVCLPSGSDKLFSVSEDGTLCLWDCKSGLCIHTVEVGCKIGCLIAEAPWVFVGLEKGVKVWNMDTEAELTYGGATSVVHCLAGADDVLFGGMEDGSIAVWKSSSPEQPVATLNGHNLGVLSLSVTAGCLYSASEDATVRVWDVKTLKCLHLLYAHIAPVTSLVCWNNYLISGSLDNTIKVWAIAEDRSLRFAHQVREATGVLALSLMHSTILLCSCANSSVRLYNIPSFTEKGTVFTKDAVNTVAIGCSGLFFTGDQSGQLDVWLLREQPSEGAEKS